MQKITDLLNHTDSTLGNLITKVQELHTLNHTIKQILRDDLPPFQISSFDKGILTITVSNAAEATYLRYQIPQIMSQLRAFPQWAGLSSVKIKIQLPQAIYKPIVIEPNQPLSQNNIEQIKSLIETLKDEIGTQALVKSLEKLVGHPPRNPPK